MAVPTILHRYENWISMKIEWYMSVKNEDKFTEITFKICVMTTNQKAYKIIEELNTLTVSGIIVFYTRRKTHHALGVNDTSIPKLLYENIRTGRRNIGPPREKMDWPTTMMIENPRTAVSAAGGHGVLGTEGDKWNQVA